MDKSKNKYKKTNKKKQNVNIKKTKIINKLNRQTIGTLTISILAIIALIVAFLINKNVDNNKSTATEVLDSFYKYMANKEEAVIYYGSDTCSYCELETPIMEQIKEDYNIDYLYIDASKLSNSEKKEILDTLDIEGSTPTISVVKDNQVEDTNVGYIDGTHLVEFLIENGILDENATYTPEKDLTFIDFDKYKDLVESDNSSIIVIGQTTCSHCIAVKPVLNHIAGKYNIEINYLNLTEMSNDEQTDLIENLKNIGYQNADNLGTPLTLIVKNKKIDKAIEGENPTSYFIRAFKNAGLISE